MAFFFFFLKKCTPSQPLPSLLFFLSSCQESTCSFHLWYLCTFWPYSNLICFSINEILVVLTQRCHSSSIYGRILMRIWGFKLNKILLSVESSVTKSCHNPWRKDDTIYKSQNKDLADCHLAPCLAWMQPHYVTLHQAHTLIHFLYSCCKMCDELVGKHLRSLNGNQSVM